jgi:hypothetical protein
MNRATERVITKYDYYQQNRKKIWTIGAGVLFLLLLFSVLFFTKTVTAERNTERIKLVTSIEVKKGDTLWDIASMYITDEYDNVNDYIEEIKESNRMVDDEIHAGSYIIIPYYADAEELLVAEQ